MKGLKMQYIKLLIVLKDAAVKDIGKVLMNKKLDKDNMIIINERNSLLNDKLSELTHGLDYILVDKKLKTDEVVYLFKDIDNEIDMCQKRNEALIELRSNISNSIHKIINFIVDIEVEDALMGDALTKYRSYELDAKYMIANASSIVPPDIEKLVISAMGGDKEYVFGKDPDKGFFLATLDGVIYEK